MADVFISYSRRNLEFVSSLAEALADRGKEVWFDQVKEPLKGLPAFSNWWEEIKLGIQGADNLLFVITPESVASPYCNAEIAHALAEEKRIVTILLRHEEAEANVLHRIEQTIDAMDESEELPPTVSADIGRVKSLARRNWLKVSAINYLVFSDERAFDVSLELLLEGLDTDIAWIRTWGQVRQAVQIWAENGFDEQDLWSEKRLKPIREEAAARDQLMSDVERDFIQDEYLRLWDEINAPVPEFESEEDLPRYHRRRSLIGDRLDELGDCERRAGVGLVSEVLPPLESDSEVRFWGDAPEHLGLPDIVWLSVEGGEVELEYDSGRFETGPFYIGKYPVTYRQHRTFLEADDGFYNPKWWQGLEVDSSQHSGAAENQNRLTGNHPADNLLWYGAVAFCRWLSARLGWPLLPEDLDVDSLRDFHGLRLPTEWEWQWAAQGGDGREYPWGPDWEDGAKANTRESGLGRTTAVGMYPAGAGACGVLDMSGNVFEWCLNEHAEPRNVRLAGREDRTRRGGSWGDVGSYARAADRFSQLEDLFPDYDLYGFRLGCIRPPSTKP